MTSNDVAKFAAHILAFWAGMSILLTILIRVLGEG